MENLFGKEIEFYNTLNRVRDKDKRYWKSSEYQYSSNNKPKLTKGLIIGVRSLWNGKIIFEDIDYGAEIVFINESLVKAYLVAVDLRRNPVYVEIDDIIK